jgi:uncharacterized membrane protein YgdD (TMEM256/DUF423 family)
MTKAFLIGGSTLAALGVILGAFGAHALKDKLQPEQIQIFETGVRYQMYHSLAIIFLFLAGDKLQSSWLVYSGWFLIIGVILFSGSIYLLACRELLGIDSWKRILGPVTPLGGLSLIAGWGCLIVAALKYSSNS